MFCRTLLIFALGLLPLSAAEYNLGDTTVTKIVINLHEQKAYFYSLDDADGWTEISSGRRGHETPTGKFPIIEKEEQHYSNLYGIQSNGLGASMPYFLRLSFDGVGMHAGELPGYPASHGCIRLPYKVAHWLYYKVDTDTSVEIIP